MATTTHPGRRTTSKRTPKRQTEVIDYQDDYSGSLLDLAARNRAESEVEDWVTALNIIMDVGGVSSSDLADRMGVSRQAAYAWRTGAISEMSTKRLTEIADALGIPTKLFHMPPLEIVEWLQERYFSTPSPWNAHSGVHLVEVAEQLGQAFAMTQRGVPNAQVAELMQDPDKAAAWMAFAKGAAGEDLRRAS